MLKVFSFLFKLFQSKKFKICHTLLLSLRCRYFHVSNSRVLFLRHKHISRFSFPLKMSRIYTSYFFFCNKRVTNKIITLVIICSSTFQYFSQQNNVTNFFIFLFTLKAVITMFFFSSFLLACDYKNCKPFYLYFFNYLHFLFIFY